MFKTMSSLSLLTLCSLIHPTANSNPKIYVEQKVDEKTASAICGEQPVIRVRGAYACAICPTFADADIPEPMLLQKMVLGKFSNSEANEIVVDTEGCEPHSNNFGGMILLEQLDEKLSIRYYEPGYRLNECLKFESSKGRDVLVCNEIYQSQGNVFGQYAAFRFGLEEASWRDLQNWIYTQDGEFIIEPTKAQQADLNDDGILDLVLNFNARGTKISTKKYTINYLFDGHIFTLADDSENTKEQLDALFSEWN
ncbi:hypothetical protein [Sessilibacter sp. MAH2]